MNQNKLQISKIQQMNICWVLMSLILLYYGVKDEKFIVAIIYIILLFCLVLYLGIKQKQKEFEENIVIGKKAKGQWE